MHKDSIISMCMSCQGETSGVRQTVWLPQLLQSVSETVLITPWRISPVYGWCSHARKMLCCKPGIPALGRTVGSFSSYVLLTMFSAKYGCWCQSLLQRFYWNKNTSDVLKIRELVAFRIIFYLICVGENLMMTALAAGSSWLPTTPGE